MKDLIASIYAACLSSLLWAPIFVPQARADLIINPFVFESAGGPSYIVDEDFEETGIPTGNTWIAVSGPAGWDSTAHTLLSGKALAMTGTGDEVRVEFGSETTVWAAFQIETVNSFSNATSYFSFRTAADSGAVAIIMQPSGFRASFFANGSTLATSSTFAFSTFTRYYVWLRYVSGGTTGIYISTTSTRPTAPADTATTYAQEVTDTAALTVDRLRFRAQASVFNSYFVDDLFVDDAEITDPW